VREIVVGVTALLFASVPAQSQQSDALRQLQGLWTLKWTAQGRSNVQRVLFASDPADGAKRIASLPFLPGQVSIFHCQGLGCNGANLVVSGSGFDCLYSHSIYTPNEFAWTFKGGTNTGGCPPDVEFRKDPPLPR
jgi:hypothetical protein